MPTISSEFSTPVENIEADYGDVRSLGFTLINRNQYSFTDLAMYKTRRTQRYNTQIEVLLGPEFDDVTLDFCLSKIEQSYPDIGEIISRGSKIGARKEIRERYARQNITGSVVENPVNRMLCLKFRGRVIDLYSIMQTDYIYDLAYSLTTYYFENLPPPKPTKFTMTREEYNTFIRRHRATKKDESTYCCLSMENIKKGQTVATTCCGHKFKSSELRKWLTKECTEPTCPLCRTNLLTTVRI